ncbi:MAG: HAD family hydrolase [bacterium]|nr:HAD family hydrolase [bacterium]
MNQKNKAVFLDRDGTLIHHVDFLTRANEMRLLRGATEAIRKLNRLGFLIIIITNQPVISRGLITEGKVRQLHALLISRLAKKGARIDDIFFCPHHPDAKSKVYGIKCICRKPEPGMILEAIKKFNIDPKKSFMAGDSIIDCLAGERAAVRTILVKTGPGHRRLDARYPDVKPNYIARNLAETIRYIEKDAA